MLMGGLWALALIAYLWGLYVEGSGPGTTRAALGASSSVAGQTVMVPRSDADTETKGSVREPLGGCGSASESPGDGSPNLLMSVCDGEPPVSNPLVQLSPGSVICGSASSACAVSGGP